MRRNVAKKRARFGIGEQQHLLHQRGETHGLALNQFSVALHLLRFVSQLSGQVERRGANHGQRRSELVRDTRNEIHSGFRQLLRLPRIVDQRSCRPQDQ